MMVAVLLGALTLGACVDDNESQSVTDVRNAKTEQLKSIAAMNNAEAQAKITLANADAAIKAAEAAQKQALADKAAAEAKIKELELKMAEATYDADLAAQLAKAEQDKIAAEYQIQLSQSQIDKLVLSLQKEMAVLQQQLLQAQKDLADKESSIADEKLKDLNKLADKYANQLNKYTSAELLVVKKKADISAAEAELKDWESLIAADVAAKEFQIQLEETQIANLKKYTNYKEDLNGLMADLQDLSNAFNLANDKYLPLNAAYNAIDVATLKTEKKVDDLEAAIEETNMYKLIDNTLDYAYLVNYTYNCSPIKTYNYKNFSITNGDLTYNSSDNSSKDSLDVELAYKDVRTLEVYVNNEIAFQDVKGKKEAIDTKDTGLKALYDAAVKKSAAAEKAWKEAAAADKAAAETAYNIARGEETTAKTNYETAETNLETAENNVEGLNLILSLVSDKKEAEDFVAAVKAYNEAIVACHTEKANAMFAKDASENAKNAAENEYKTLLAVANGTTTTSNSYVMINMVDLFTGNWPSGILGDNANFDGNWLDSNYPNFDWGSLQAANIYIRIVTTNAGIDGAIGIDNAIKTFESDIEDLKDEIATLKNTTSAEETLVGKKAEVEGLNAKLSTLKIRLDATKAKLDAAIKAATPAE